MSDGPAHGSGGGLFLRSLVSADSYGLVLVLIVLSYTIAVSLSASWAPSVVLFVAIVTVWFALRTSKARRSVRAAASVLLVIAAVVGIVGVFTGSGDRQSPGVVLVTSLLFLIAPVSILRHVALRPVVDRESMLGAVSAYLLIGMCFAFLYRFLGIVQSDPFFGSVGDGSIGQDLYFSFTTLTTTGYGNLIPAHEPGRTFSVAEMVLGQLFLITAVGKIVAAWRPKKWSGSDDSGPKD